MHNIFPHKHTAVGKFKFFLQSEMKSTTSGQGYMGYVTNKHFEGYTNQNHTEITVKVTSTHFLRPDMAA